MEETESTEWLNRNPGQTKTDKGEEAKKGEKQEMTLSLSLSPLSLFVITQGFGETGELDFGTTHLSYRLRPT
jgi:hypothetical protein